MKELFSRLNEREKARLRLLFLVFLLVLMFFFFISRGEQRGYFSLADELKAREKVYSDIEQHRMENAEEWAGWEEAYRDMGDLKKTHFYQEGEGVNGLLLDLHKIFAEAGITARSLRYNYASLENNQVKKINVTFNFTGSYLILKKFLDTVERFPKFLLLESIDFMKISGNGSILELKIVLAGYYENF
jgi:Tfp pilus assembly protein PilO